MQTRPNPFSSHLGLVKPLIDFGTLAQADLEHTLTELVKIRASQINGCARCLDMHIRDARKNGETEERIYMLDAWREAPFYSDRERAALEWTEALTRLYEQGAPDEAYRSLQAHFTEEEQIKVTLLISAINAFNRINVGLRVRLPSSAGRQAA